MSLVINGRVKSYDFKKFLEEKTSLGFKEREYYFGRFNKKFGGEADNLEKLKDWAEDMYKDRQTRGEGAATERNCFEVFEAIKKEI